ncbi:unnamed protein product, partial [Anisakis simplex]|uniref:Transposase n=1 Tax=Anisakis simplex TaxID=6269 RepID=A0A0M3JMZ7_ANISI
MGRQHEDLGVCCGDNRVVDNVRYEALRGGEAVAGRLQG